MSLTTMTATSVPTEDDGAVRAVLDRVYAAWADNDADAFVADYADDATAILPGMYLPNKDAVRATMTAVFAGSLRGSTAVHAVQRVSFPAIDTAIVISQGGVVPEGQTEPPADSRALETWVLARRDGAWLIEAFHSCQLNVA